MRHLIALLCLLVASSLGLVGLIHSRRDMELQLVKASYFENVRVRVTNDVLRELQSNIAEGNTRLDQSRKQIQDLTAEITSAQEAADGKNAKLNTCVSDLNQFQSDISVLEREKTSNENEFNKNKASLDEKINNLKAEAAKRSKFCEYILKSSVEGMKLCGIVPVLAKNAA